MELLHGMPEARTSGRAEELAGRLLAGARALAALAESLSEAEWRMPVGKDGRTVGVIVHHVASVYPLEIELAQEVAAGRAVSGVTMRDVHEMNAKHSRDHAGVSRKEALELLARNSGAAAAAIRALSDEALERAAPVSLYEDAPLTCQFVLEDHAVRHSYHHLAAIRQGLSGRQR